MTELLGGLARLATWASIAVLVAAVVQLFRHAVLHQVPWSAPAVWLLGAWVLVDTARRLERLAARRRGREG